MGHLLIIWGIPLLHRNSGGIHRADCAFAPNKAKIRGFEARSSFPDTLTYHIPWRASDFGISAKLSSVTTPD